ncbi:MAG: S49 family peptidase [Planctomycetota bacterium]
MPSQTDLQTVAKNLKGLQIPAKIAASNPDVLGPWLIESHHAQGFFASLASAPDLSDSAEEVQMTQILSAGSGKNRASVGAVDIRGVVSANGTFSNPLGSMRGAAIEINRLAADPSIAGILIRLDTPGGTLGGLEELVNAIRAARSSKPVVALVRDMAASAGYWIASQADAIFASGQRALVGSIGVFVYLWDSSKAFEDFGIRPLLIRAQEDRQDNVKGIGMPGIEIDDTFRQYMQEHVDQVHEMFMADIVSGRNATREQLDKYANGQVFFASEVKNTPLITKVRNQDEALAFILRERNKRTTSQGTTTMSITAKDLRAACPQADADWILDRLENHADAEASDHAAAYTKMLEGRAEAAEKEAAEKLKEAQAKIDAAEKATKETEAKLAEAEKAAEEAEARAAKRPSGASKEPKTGAADDNGDPDTAGRSAIESRTEELMAKSPKLTREAAWLKACQDLPEAREQMVREHNIEAGRPLAAARV